MKVGDTVLIIDTKFRLTYRETIINIGDYIYGEIFIKYITVDENNELQLYNKEGYMMCTDCTGEQYINRYIKIGDMK